MGRPRKPTAIEIAEGRPGKRQLNDREPQPTVCEPTMPAYLDDEARKEWRRLVPILISMRVLTEADGMNLANLCQAYSLLVRAQKAMQDAAKDGKSALLMKTPSGYVQQSPLIGIINSQVAVINSLSREFGLTPASRTKIQTEAGSDTEDDLAAILSQPRTPRVPQKIQ